MAIGNRSILQKLHMDLTQSHYMQLKADIDKTSQYLNDMQPRTGDIIRAVTAPARRWLK